MHPSRLAVTNPRLPDLSLGSGEMLTMQPSCGPELPPLLLLLLPFA